MTFLGLFSPASSRALWWITFILIAGYFVGIWILAAIGLLDQKDYVQSLSAFIGWIVTLILAVLHFRQTQNENENTRREEVKKRLQIEAFQKINESVTKCSEIVTKITTPYRTIPVSLSLWRVHNPSMITSELQRFRSVISEHHIMLWDAVTPFILTVEAHEVTVIEYDHLRKFIQFRFDDAQDAIKKWLIA